jgi:hypothetical protein
MRLRQLIPTKFATAYRALGTVAEPKDVPEFCTWWMWLGHVFNVNRTEI